MSDDAGLGDIMFPKSRDGRFVDYRAAAAICRTCPVLNECLAWALAAEEPHGCWGGTTPTQRHRMIQARDRANGHGTPDGYAAHRDAGEPPCARCRGAMGAATRYADEAAS